MKFISLFAGVGGFDLALERLGHECVYANEWDKYSAITYEKNFKRKPDTRDIRTVGVDEIPDHELLVGGFPCQAFSIAGKRGGFSDTRGTLFFEISRILNNKRPRYFLLENVKGLLSHDNGKTIQTIFRVLTNLGYEFEWQVLNSKNFGVPQNRERVFIVGHLRGTNRPKVFPVGESSKQLNEIQSASDREQKRLQGRPEETQSDNVSIKNRWGGQGRPDIKQMNNPKHSNDRVYAEKGISPTLNTMQGGRRQPFVALTERRTEEAKHLRRLGIVKDTRSLKKLTPREDDLANTVTTGDIKNSSLTNGMRIRRLTPLEYERLQGFPDNWSAGVSDTQRYKQMGNAVTVNVVYEIAKHLWEN